VRVWGYYWDRCPIRHPRLLVTNELLDGVEYAKAINATRVNLGFLRKANRDLQTTRTMEIPGCGGFLLAERTDEHLRLFREGAEAEFFGSTAELVTKCRYYLEHDDERRRIAAAGHRRCLTSGYSNEGTLAPVIAGLERRLRQR
jgi:spore maturation protein CgeB